MHIFLLIPLFAILGHYLPAIVCGVIITIAYLAIAITPFKITLAVYMILFLWGLYFMVTEFPIRALILYLLSAVPVIPTIIAIFFSRQDKNEQG